MQSEKVPIETQEESRDRQCCHRQSLTVRFAQAHQVERQLRAEDLVQASSQTNPIAQTALSETRAENQAEVFITRQTNPIEKAVLSDTYAEKQAEVCTQQNQLVPDSPVVSQPLPDEPDIVPAVASAGEEMPQSPTSQAGVGWRDRVARQHKLAASQPRYLTEAIRG